MLKYVMYAHLFFFCLLPISFVHAQSAPSIERFFIFGDSLSDKGQIFKRTLGIFPSSPPYFKGRMSNGPIWAEYVDWNLINTPVYIYAEAGATAATYSPNKEGIQYYFLKNLDKLFKQFKRDKFTITDQDLIIVFLGSNDYMSLRWLDDNNITGIIESFDRFNAKMYALGARNFLYINQPDLGKTPRALNQGLDKKMLDVSRKHNRALKDLADRWQGKTTFKVLPLFDIFENAIQNAGELGIENVTDPCYVRGSRLDDLGDVLHIQEEDRQFGVLSDEKREELQALLQDPILAQSYRSDSEHMPLEHNFNHCSRYFFWDDVHPSARIHERLGIRVQEFLERHWDLLH